MKKLASLLLLLISTGVLGAPINVAVTVENSRNQAPVPSAQVTLWGKQAFRKDTDSNGKTMFSGIPDGKYRIAIQKNGYKKKNADVYLDCNKKTNWSIRIRLGKETSAPPKPVVVVPPRQPAVSTSTSQPPVSTASNPPEKTSSVSERQDSPDVNTEFNLDYSEGKLKATNPVGGMIASGLVGVLTGIILLVILILVFIKWKKSKTPFKMVMSGCGCLTLIVFCLTWLMFILFLIFIMGKKSETQEGGETPATTQQEQSTNNNNQSKAPAEQLAPTSPVQKTQDGRGKAIVESSSTIKVSVQDNITGKYINANIRIQAANQRGTIREQSQISVVNIAAGNCSIWVSASGYQPKTGKFYVDPLKQKIYNVRFKLSPVVTQD